jgi:hypothetical protein
MFVPEIVEPLPVLAHQIQAQTIIKYRSIIKLFILNLALQRTSTASISVVLGN